MKNLANGKIYFSYNPLMPDTIKLGRTQITVAEKERQLSRPATFPVNFEIFSYFSVSNIFLGETRIIKFLLNKNFKSLGGGNEVFEMSVEDVRRLWPEMKRALGKILLADTPALIKAAEKPCHCLGSSQLKPLKRAITMARGKHGLTYVINNLAKMLSEKQVKLPPNNRTGGAILNLVGLAQMTGIGRNNFYRGFNRLENLRDSLVEEVGFCQGCLRDIVEKDPSPKPDRVKVIKERIRELYSHNKYVKKVIDVKVQARRKASGKIHVWRAELLLTNEVRYKTKRRNYSTTHLPSQTIEDETFKKLVNPDIERLDDDFKVRHEEQILHAQLCSHFGFVPASIELEIILGRKSAPESFHDFRKNNSSFNEYKVLLTKYFLLEDGSREEKPLDSTIIEIGRLQSKFDKPKSEDLFAGRQDGRQLKTKLQKTLLKPVFVERVYIRQDGRYAATFRVGNSPPVDRLLQVIKFTARNLKGEIC